MSTITIYPSTLNGTVSVPPSKSAAHRAIICAALAKGVSVLSPVELSNDIRATMDCMQSLGAKLTYDNGTLTVDGTHIFEPKTAVLDCGESGSTLRFLIPAAAVGGVRTEFVGHGRLPERPIGIYLDCLPQHGIECQTEGGLPLQINGHLRNGIYQVPGNVSSQFITGLLLTLPLLDGDSEIVLTSPAQSIGYINMTIDIMQSFGVEIQSTADGWHIKGGQSYQPQNFTIEGDWSQAAFFMTAAALGGEITIDNLDIHSTQGDKECMEIYQRFGAEITTEDNGNIRIRHHHLTATDIDATNIPDMVPALAVTAALAEGTTHITGAERLRIKESDRLKAMHDNLSQMGAKIEETPDGLVITGVSSLHSADLNGYNDHRIVMSLSSASAALGGAITVSDKESINKSYPTFFKDFTELGGKTDVIMG